MPQKTSSAPSFATVRPDEVVRADRDAARRHEDVRLEPPRERCLVRRLVVGDAAEHLDVGAHLAEQRCEHQAVRLVDLAVAQRLPRPAKLGAGCDDRDTRSSRAPGRRHARGRQRGQPRGRQDRPGGKHGLTLDDVASARTHVVSRGDGLRHDDGVALVGDVLDRDDRVRAIRDDAAGRDPHRLSGGERAGRRTTRRDAGDDGECPGRVGGAKSEAVHRRAREARQVDHGAGVLREDATGGGVDGHLLGRKWTSALEHPAERLVDGEKLGHGGDATHGVRSDA